MTRLVICLIVLAIAHQLRAEELPKSLDPRLKIELFAEHPQIVTPTGLDVDHRGRVFAIESNTHFPPEGYKGHPSDRVLVMSDSDGDGKADKIVVFTDGLKYSMSVAVRPIWFPVSGKALAAGDSKKPAGNSVKPPAASAVPLTSVYIATRREIFLFHDDDGDDKADRKESIVKLDTKGDYPHNGLAGFAIDALGWMYFGFGENLGADYKIIGSDGTTLSGGGEGGNIYRCRLDGSKLSQIATGFWNPHASCFDAFERLFTVDNDADSRPPCRLLHVIPGGDYGYRFRNGRKGLHPFTAWNGEIPGTLPMVAGTGEAPSGILAYESDGLPEEYLGNLLVTSWGDHRIDRFRLQPKGTSFTSLAEPLITGGENFRPVGLATAPDGSLFCTDWVLRDYKLHGHGRIWRIAPKTASKQQPIKLTTITPNQELKQLETLLASARKDVRRVAAKSLSLTEPGRELLNRTVADFDKSDRMRLESLWQLAQLPNAERGDALFGMMDQHDEVSDALLELVAREELPADKRVLDSLASRTLNSTDDLIAIKARPSTFFQLTELTRTLLKQANASPEANVGKLLAAIVMTQNDPFLTHTAIRLTEVTLSNVGVVAKGLKEPLVAVSPGEKPGPLESPELQREMRLIAVLAARRIDSHHSPTVIAALADTDTRIQRAAVQWVAEEKLTDLQPRVAAMFDSQGMTTELFLATIAALEMLDGKKPEDFDKTPAEQYVVPLLKDEKRSPAVRAQALRLVSPTDKSLDAPLFASLLKSDHEPLRLETVRTLQGAKPDVSGELLRELVANDKLDVQLRAEALVGLAAVVKAEPIGGPSRKLLRTFLNNSSLLPLRLEALRAARPLIADDLELRDDVLGIAKTVVFLADGIAAVELSDQLALAFAEAKFDPPQAIKLNSYAKPKDRQEWMDQLNRGREANSASGRRVFFHPNGPGCFKCHIVDGRGGRVGPDLSRAVGTMNRIQLIQSILEPSREIAPQFVSWTFELKDGKVVTGMVVHENEGKTIVGNAEGQAIEIKTADIESRTPQKISVMPEKLAERMTLQEFRDVLAFLEMQK